MSDVKEPVVTLVEDDEDEEIEEFYVVKPEAFGDADGAEILAEFASALAAAGDVATAALMEMLSGYMAQLESLALLIGEEVDEYDEDDEGEARTQPDSPKPDDESTEAADDKGAQV